MTDDDPVLLGDVAEGDPADDFAVPEDQQQDTDSDDGHEPADLSELDVS